MQSSPSSLSPTRPSSRSTTKATKPTITLTSIQTQLSALYATARDTNTVPQINHAEYIQFYTDICNYSMAAKARKTDFWDRKGRTLFMWLDGEIRSHTSIIRDRIFDTDTRMEEEGGEEGRGIDSAKDAARGTARDATRDTAREVLNRYTEAYTQFEKLASLVGNLLGFWDRHWLRTEWIEKKTRVADVREMHARVWKEEVLGVRDGGEGREDGVERLVNGVTNLRGTEGSVSESNEGLIKDVLESLSSLGVGLETQDW